jgi:phosphoribosylanthranilate isomerase
VPRVKVCGVVLPDDAALAASLGVDFIGLNFWPRSKRHVTAARGPLVAAAARGSGAVKIVGVFVDADVDEIAEVHARVGLDVVQLHGDEPLATCQAVANALYVPVWKAIAVGSRRDLEGLEVWPTDAIVLDAPTPGRGGSGVAFDHGLAREARERYASRLFVLAGGLTPDNVAAAIATVEPWCVDVASGVEAAPGIKDATRLRAFVAAVKSSAA